MNNKNAVDESLDQHINEILGTGGRLVLSTSSDCNSSASSVFYGKLGEDLVFFTFNPTRKAEQIRANPRVQAVVWPGGEGGIRGLQIEGWCSQITDPEEQDRARQAVLATTEAFREFMDDDFLRKNRVTGYYRLRPLVITYVDFYAEEKFKWREYPHNQVSTLQQLSGDLLRGLLLWLRALRAPFFTATLVPVLLGSVIAAGQMPSGQAFDWCLFWIVLAGALCAHAGTNLANDYGDHLTGNDRINATPSPFNGGSRIIQAGLIRPWKILAASILFFSLTIACGLYINRTIGGDWLAMTPLLAIGLVGVLLGIAYTLGPFRLSYQGFGELAIALGFGPVMVLGPHYVLTHGVPGDWQWQEPLLASIPVGLLVMSIVWINQFQDAPADAASNKNNWVVRMTRQGDRFFYRNAFNWFIGFLGLSFASVLLLAVLPWFSDMGTPWALIALLPGLLVFYMRGKGLEWLDQIDTGSVDWQRHPYLLLPVNVSTIGLHLLTGLLLVLAWLLDA